MEPILLLIAIIVLYFWSKSRGKGKLSTYLTDHYMRIDSPIAVCGAPDVIWSDENDVLIVGDYKSRENGRVYESDIIQLSVYKLLLEYTQHRSVADFGYVHFRDGRRSRVNLLNAREVIDLYWRYQDISQGSIQGQCINRKGYCQYCRYLGEC